MVFLRARRTAETSAWWAAAAAATDRPSIVESMVRGDNSIVCDPPEAEEALAWASAQPTWSPTSPALWIEDPLARPVEPLPPGVAP